VDEPGAAPWVPSAGGVRGLASALPDCRGCELWRDAIQAVPGRGPARARLVLVGEQPGDVEDHEGRAFVGPAGRLLDEVLAEAGIDVAEVYLTNAVKHFRHRGTRGKRRIHQSPTRGQVVACRPWLAAELDRVRPEGVVVLGSVAASSMLGPSFRVTEHRGRRLAWPGATGIDHPPAWFVPTVHPASVLRAEDRSAARRALVADLVVAREA